MITPIQHAKQQKQPSVVQHKDGNKQSARWCPCCGQVVVVPKGEPSPAPSPAMVEALRGLLAACAPGADQTVKNAGGDESVLQSDIRRARAALLLAATGKDTL